MTELKGGVSTTTYIWHSSGEACEQCQSLDGQEFTSVEDIPDRPHPNCQCTREERVVEDNCDCWEEIDAGLDEIESVATGLEIEKEEAESIEDEVESSKQEIDAKIIEAKEHAQKICGDCEYYYLNSSVEYNTHYSLTRIYTSIKQKIHIAIQAFFIFYENMRIMESMKKYNGVDKYFHAKANCETSRLGEFGEKMAEILSEAKEIWDMFKKIQVQKQDFDKVFQDCNEDLAIDKYGREVCNKDGSCQDNVIDIIRIFKKMKKY